MTPALKEYINDWLLKAEHDIISAQRLLEIEPMILDNACFHCQQAMEKSLKAFLYYHEKEAGRTHDVEFLIKECSVFDTIFSTVNPLNINDYAVKGRYPDSSLMPDIEEASGYYQLAIAVNTLVKDRIVFPE